MNRKVFQELTKIRVREARTLLDAGHYPGAYYLIGYAVECALKACVSKQVKRYDFPDKKFAKDAYTHELEELMGLAGLTLDFEQDRKANTKLEANWQVVKDWNESFRYDLGITRQQARDLYSACTGRNGIFPWIRKTMVETILTKEMIDIGAIFIRKLDEHGLRPDAAFWLYFPEEQTMETYYCRG